MANQVGDVGDLAPCSLEREIPEKTHKMLVFKDQPPSQTQVTSGPGIRRSHPFAPGAATDSALASKRGGKCGRKPQSVVTRSFLHQCLEKYRIFADAIKEIHLFLCLYSYTAT